MKRPIRAAALVSLLAVLSTPVLAHSDKTELESLERRIDMLQTRIATLESYRTFTSFMPTYAERFHVMHFAGESGDWAVAAHELQEMKRLTKLSTTIDADKGKLMQAMMEPSLHGIEKAIEHGNRNKFQQALAQMIDSCNGCHEATGSGFVQATLDAHDSISIRHAHVLMQREATGGHSHGMETMMPAKPAEEHHDDSGLPAHKH